MVEPLNLFGIHSLCLAKVAQYTNITPDNYPTAEHIMHLMIRYPELAWKFISEQSDMHVVYGMIAEGVSVESDFTLLNKDKWKNILLAKHLAVDHLLPNYIDTSIVDFTKH